MGYKTQNKISWITNEGPSTPKNKDWVWGAIILGLAVSFSSFFFGNMLLGIFILVATTTLIIHGAKDGHQIETIVLPAGIKIDKQFFPYENIHSFYIREDEKKDKTVLSIHTNGVLVPFITVNIEGVNPDVIREYLLDFLEERYHEKGISDKVSDYFDL